MSRRPFVFIKVQAMSHQTIRLQDGTLIRHRTAGYEGQIDGTTEIKECFTSGGELLNKSTAKETFQYRIVVKGEPMRRIAPAEDLEILEAVVQIVCSTCNFSFQNKPGLMDKPGGRCECGGWICPACLACQETHLCPRERQRLSKRLGTKNGAKKKAHLD